MRFHLVSFLLGAAAVVMVIVLIGLRGQASAEDWLLGPAFSHHFRSEGQREWHPGIGFERHFSKSLRGIFDIRQSSSNDLSIYAVGCYLPWKASGWRVGGCGGVATGYEGRAKAEAERRERTPQEALTPIIFGAFAASLERKRWGVNIGHVPAAGGVTFLEVKFPLRK